MSRICAIFAGLGTDYLFRPLAVLQSNAPLFKKLMPHVRTAKKTVKVAGVDVDVVTKFDLKLLGDLIPKVVPLLRKMVDTWRPLVRAPNALCPRGIWLVVQIQKLPDKDEVKAHLKVLEKRLVQCDRMPRGEEREQILHKVQTETNALRDIGQTMAGLIYASAELPTVRLELSETPGKRQHELAAIVCVMMLWLYHVGYAADACMDQDNKEAVALRWARGRLEVMKKALQDSKHNVVPLCTNLGLKGAPTPHFFFPNSS